MKLATAMISAATVTAAFVSGKATRDALFLTSLDFTALPTMLMVTSVVSILLVLLYSRAADRMRPAALVPALFAVSGALFIAEWLFRAHAPERVAVLVYLQISGAGPLLASGFWLIVTEGYDPRSARRSFGQITAAGTLGGLLSALVAERVAALFGAPAMLLVLAALQFLGAVLVRRLALQGVSGRPAPAASEAASHSLAAHPAAADLSRPRPALATIMETPYLRHLALLVLFGTLSAALVDYLFKAQAVATFGRGDRLLRFFAAYYAGTGLVTLVLQASFSRVVLDRYGIGLSTGTPSWALLAGSVSSLVAPGLGSLLLARGSESVLRSSWFRAGYELFYTPIPADEKRSAKSLIDVGLDRLGDAAGGGLVRLAALLVPAIQTPAILVMAMGSSLVAIAAASRLNRGYLKTLASSLVSYPKGDLPAGGDPLEHQTTRDMRPVIEGLRRRREVATTVVRPARPSAHAAMDETDTRRSGDTTGSVMRALLYRGEWTGAVAPRRSPSAGSSGSGQDPQDPLMGDIASLRSRDRQRVVGVLSRAEGVSTPLVPHVIPLLAWEGVSNHAMFALRKVAEEHVGQIADALIDPNQDFAVRRRLARVLSIGVSARAAAAASLGLDDARFDVRFQSARSLMAIVDKNPNIEVEQERIFAVILREVAVSRPVWESRRLLEGVNHDSPLDAFVRDRAGESLAHVFTLLSLVLPREPLQIAFRSLQTNDDYLRGTALEYLEGVLPANIRRKLWPFIETGPLRRSTRPRQDVIADLMRSHHSVTLNLEALRARSAQASADTA